MNERLNNVPEEEIKDSSEHDIATPEVADEARQFNEMQNRRDVSSSFLSKHLRKEQTPEMLESQIEAALEKVRDTWAFGTMLHGTNSLSEQTFIDIMTNGLKCRKLLAMKGEPGKHRGLASETNYPWHVSFEMNVGQERIPFAYYYILDPEYIRELLRRNNALLHLQTSRKTGEQLAGDEIKFVGNRFGSNPYYAPIDKFDPTAPIKQSPVIKQVLEYAEQAGWIDAAAEVYEREMDNPVYKEYDLPHVEYDKTVFANTYFRPIDYKSVESQGLGATPYPGEIILSASVMSSDNYPNPLCGIIVPEESQEQVLGWLNQISVEDIRNAMPIYNEQGDLLWPKRMSRQEIVSQSQKS